LTNLTTVSFLRKAQASLRLLDAVTHDLSGFGGLVVPNFAGSNPVEAAGFFGRKNLQHAFLLRGEVKPSVPCRSFAACTIILQ
jgi:hypothetical protein